MPPKPLGCFHAMYHLRHLCQRNQNPPVLRLRGNNSGSDDPMRPTLTTVTCIDCMPLRHFHGRMTTTTTTPNICTKKIGIFAPKTTKKWSQVGQGGSLVKFEICQLELLLNSLSRDETSCRLCGYKPWRVRTCLFF